MNEQPVEKQEHLESGLLDVHSIFSTIQGEGPFTGQRAIFIRLAGCNLQCPLCDTDYTSVRSAGNPAQILKVVTDLIGYRATMGEGYLVVITGGEPFRQNIRPLVNALLSVNLQVQIETNGTLYQDLPFNEITIVCSPKAGKIHPKLLPHISALKYVLHADEKNYGDGLPVRALNHPVKLQLARPPVDFSGTIYLQPVDEQDPEQNVRHLEAVIESVFEHGYTLQLQTHKILEME